MPKTKAPPWVRWAGEVIVDDTEDVLASIDKLQNGILVGWRHDEVIPFLNGIRGALRSAQKEALKLQNTIYLEDIASWLMDQDETTKLVIRAALGELRD